MQEMQETQVWSLGQEDPLAEEMATYFNILAWKIPRDRGASRAAVRSISKSQTQLSTHALSTLSHSILTELFCKWPLIDNQGNITLILNIL